MHIILLCVSNTLRKIIIRVQGLVFRYVCRVRVRKRKIFKITMATVIPAL